MFCYWTAYTQDITFFITWNGLSTHKYVKIAQEKKHDVQNTYIISLYDLTIKYDNELLQSNI